jgi:hypothetical protein
MNRSVAIVLAFLMLSIACRDVAIYSSFVWNQSYIAEFLCVNQDKPEMECNGKCHLVKTLEKSNEQEEKKLPMPNEEDRPTIQLIQNTLEKVEFYSDLHRIKHRLSNTLFPEENFIDDFLKPPQS